MGDQLLVEIGHRLTEVSERRGKVARVFRLSGDEFVVIVPSCGDPCVISEIASAMLEQLAQPFHDR